MSLYRISLTEETKKTPEQKRWEGFLKEKFSDIHDQIYDSAKELLKRENICQIEIIDGKVTCYASRKYPTITPHDKLCCKGCTYHDPKKGCTVRSLGCKLWLCHELESEKQVSEHASAHLKTLRGVAASLHLTWGRKPKS